MEIIEVHVLYGFRFRGEDCLEGEKYAICGEELFYKRHTPSGLGIKETIKPKFPLRLYREESGERCLGYCISKQKHKTQIALGHYHDRMKQFEEDKPEVDALFEDIIADCGLSGAGEIDFTNVPIYSDTPKV